MKARLFIFWSHGSCQLPVFDEDLFVQAVALHLRLAPVFPASPVPVPPNERKRVFPAPRGERGSAALYQGSMEAAGCRRGPFKPDYLTYRPVRLKINHCIVIVVTGVVAGQVAAEQMDS